MIWNLLKAVISAAVIVAVAEVSGRFPRLGALLLTLPLVSSLAFILLWTKKAEKHLRVYTSGESSMNRPLA